MGRGVVDSIFEDHQLKGSNCETLVVLMQIKIICKNLYSLNDAVATILAPVQTATDFA